MELNRSSCFQSCLMDLFPCFRNGPRFYKAKESPRKKKVSRQKANQNQEPWNSLRVRVKELECQQSAELLVELSKVIQKLDDKIDNMEAKLNSLSSYLHEFEDISHFDEPDFSGNDSNPSDTTTQNNIMNCDTSVAYSASVFKEIDVSDDKKQAVSAHQVDHQESTNHENDISTSIGSLEKIEVNSKGDVLSQESS